MFLLSSSALVLHGCLNSVTDTIGLTSSAEETVITSPNLNPNPDQNSGGSDSGNSGGGATSGGNSGGTSGGNTGGGSGGGGGGAFDNDNNDIGVSFTKNAIFPVTKINGADDLVQWASTSNVTGEALEAWHDPGTGVIDLYPTSVPNASGGVRVMSTECADGVLNVNIAESLGCNVQGYDNGGQLQNYPCECTVVNVDNNNSVVSVTANGGSIDVCLTEEAATSNPGGNPACEAGAGAPAGPPAASDPPQPPTPDSIGQYSQLSQMLMAAGQGETIVTIECGASDGSFPGQVDTFEFYTVFNMHLH